MKPKHFKVVFDTNIYISAILFGGNPRQCLELAREKSFELFSSKAILLEFSQELHQKFHWRKEEVKETIEGILVFAKPVTPKVKVNIIKDAPKDNRILECALEVEADYIVSGDKKHLLSLGKFRNIPIISAKQFLDLLYKKSE